MKNALDRTDIKKIDKTRQKLHALECATGCTSCICNVCTCLDRWLNDCFVSFAYSFCVPIKSIFISQVKYQEMYNAGNNMCHLVELLKYAENYCVHIHESQNLQY